MSFKPTKEEKQTRQTSASKSKSGNMSDKGYKKYDKLQNINDPYEEFQGESISEQSQTPGGETPYEQPQQRRNTEIQPQGDDHQTIDSSASKETKQRSKRQSSDPFRLIEQKIQKKEDDVQKNFQRVRDQVSKASVISKMVGQIKPKPEEQPIIQKLPTLVNAIKILTPKPQEETVPLKDIRNEENLKTRVLEESFSRYSEEGNGETIIQNAKASVEFDKATSTTKPFVSQNTQFINNSTTVILDANARATQMVDINKLSSEEFSEYKDSVPDKSQDDEEGKDSSNSSSTDGDEDRKAGVFIKNKYHTRMDQDFDDSNSQDNDNAEGDLDLAEGQTKFKILRQMEKSLLKQVEQNKQQLEVEKQKEEFNAKSDKDVRPNKRFKHFDDIFSSMVASQNVITHFPIISCTINHNSKSVFTVTKKNDLEYYIRSYNIDTKAMMFSEQFKGKYIKLKEIEQTDDGDYFAVCYIDNGNFKIRTFKEQGVSVSTGKKTEAFQRTEQEIADEELDLNPILGIDNTTKVIYNLNDPFITCTFVGKDILFVNLFHTTTLTHHHFFYNIQTRLQNRTLPPNLQQPFILEHHAIQLDCNGKNFPTRCFYNTLCHEIQSFYRQGHSFRVNVESVIIPDKHDTIDHKGESFIFQRIIDRDLGEMFLYRDKILIVRSSCEVLFFKLQWDHFEDIFKWVRYSTLHCSGRVYYMNKNDLFQIATSSKIYFYKIDSATGEPELSNMMNNFMDCAIMMYGMKGKYCITYKINEKSFDIYRRKYVHDYKVTLHGNYNFEGSRCIPFNELNILLVTHVNRIKFFDMDQYTELKKNEIDLELWVSDTRERNEIIAIQKSHNEEFFAVISGKNLASNTQQCNQLFIFKRERKFNTTAVDKFKEYKRINLQKDLPKLKNFCMEFHFLIPQFLPNEKGELEANPNKDPTTLIFVSTDRILHLNFEERFPVLTTAVQLAQTLNRQPQFFWMNELQTHYIIASEDAGLHYDAKRGRFIDIDALYNITAIKEITHDAEDECFYILVNRYQEKLGLFLIRFDEKRPQKHKFILKIPTGLQIGDADIATIHYPSKGYKELVLSYKTTFLNTYTIFVIDISTKDFCTLFKHQSFQLWESKIFGTLLNKNYDYVTLNQNGLSVASLSNEQKRAFSADDQDDYMCHSLESTNFLKLVKTNFINFEFDGARKIISIVQQYQKQLDSGDEETRFEEIFKIEIHSITLRELLLFQSMYVCPTQSDILDLVREQPSSKLFLKSFLELDGSNMISILSFDSQCMKELLSVKCCSSFQKDFPVFYRTKIQKSNNKDKYFYQSAVDYALRNNQVSAVQYIVNHVIHFQDNYVSSYLFRKNFHQMVEKGVQVAKLLDSNVFKKSFDYDEWPSLHTDEESYIRPYNGSIQDLRNKYREIFHEDRFQPINVDGEDEVPSNAIHKISYTINMVSVLGEYIDYENGRKEMKNRDMSILELCINAVPEQPDIFECQQFIDYIDFKWNTFGRSFYMLAFIMHLFYIGLLTIYVYQIYMNGNLENVDLFGKMICVGIIYPATMNFLEMYKKGIAYFYDFSNYNDLIYVWAGLINVILQNSGGPFQFACKFLMSQIMIQQITKTFSLLRIMKNLSYLTTMLRNVLSDLTVFGIFFTVLVFLISMIFAVIGAGNPNIPGSFQDDYFQTMNEFIEKGWVKELPPFQEYSQIGIFAGYVAQTLRISVGDFNFDATKYLSPEENALWWLVWVITVLMTNMIFLNFIIAEASASYEKVISRIHSMQNKERAMMISDAEILFVEQMKTEKLFPKYIIVREVEQ